MFSFAKITTVLCISSILKKLYIIKARLLNLMMPCFTRRSAAKNSSLDCFLNALVQVRLLSLLQKEKIGKFADFWWSKLNEIRTNNEITFGDKIIVLAE